MLRILPTAMSQWLSVLSEAELEVSYQLSCDVENYLVMLLMRFTDRPQVVGDIVALDFLDGINATSHRLQWRMKDVGDKCLFFSGIFPHISQRRRVSERYYVGMGQSAYGILSEHLPGKSALLYADLSVDFEACVKVLQALRT